MEKINVYRMVGMFYKGQEIRLHIWTIHEDGSETCFHKTFSDRFDHELFNYRDCEVIQFNAVKKNTIEIIAMRDMRKDAEG